MAKLSAVIITRDEEADLGRALDSVAFADERLVVDSGSRDGTVALARARGARVLHREFDGFGPQKRWATAQAAHDWILALDADEEVDAELGAAIRALLAGEPARAAYRLCFRTVFLGRPFTHGSLSRGHHVRLFDRRRAGWDDAPIHEKVQAGGPVGALPGLVLHRTVRDLADALGKMDRYSAATAAGLHARGVRRGRLATVLAGPFHFLRSGVLKGNLLNGYPGLAWSLLAGASATIKNLRLEELWRASDALDPGGSLASGGPRPQGLRAAAADAGRAPPAGAPALTASGPSR